MREQRRISSESNGNPASGPLPFLSDGIRPRVFRPHPRPGAATVSVLGESESRDKRVSQGEGSGPEREVERKPERDRETQVVPERHKRGV